MNENTLLVASVKVGRKWQLQCLSLKRQNSAEVSIKTHFCQNVLNPSRKQVPLLGLGH
jgi:hypothetical protein